MSNKIEIDPKDNHVVIINGTRVEIEEMKIEVSGGYDTNDWRSMYSDVMELHIMIGIFVIALLLVITLSVVVYIGFSTKARYKEIDKRFGKLIDTLCECASNRRI